MIKPIGSRMLSLIQLLKGSIELPTLEALHQLLILPRQLSTISEKYFLTFELLFDNKFLAVIFILKICSKYFSFLNKDDFTLRHFSCLYLYASVLPV